MAKIYAIRESGMSPEDIPTKGYNNENINPAKKMSCAGVVLAGRALPRGKLKTIHRKPLQNQNSDVSKKRIHRNSTKISNPDVSSSQNLSSSSQVYQIKQPALLHSPNSKRIAAQIHRSRPQTADSDVFTHAPKSHPIEFLIPLSKGAEAVAEACGWLEAKVTL